MTNRIVTIGKNGKLNVKIDQQVPLKSNYHKKTIYESVSDYEREI